MIEARIMKDDPLARTKFINPKCGHEIEFHYGCPGVCPIGKCVAPVVRVSALKGSYNQDNRVKYFIGRPI